MMDSRAVRKLLLVQVILNGLIIEGASFNRKLTGVEFSPFIYADTMDRPALSSYTTENVKTMLEVISTKFSRILIYCDDAPSVSYKRNQMYYDGEIKKATTAEIAANINRERGNLSITVAIGIYPWQIQSAFINNTDFAVEASQVAHSIFPGTVEGYFIYAYGDNLNKQLSENIKYLRKKSSSLGLPIGIKHYFCGSSFRQSVLQADSIEVWTQKRRVLINLDFIICELRPDASVFKEKGSIAAFHSIEKQILAQRDGINSIEYHIQVMWYTGWIRLNAERLRYNVTKNIRDLCDYWLRTDEFAAKHNYAIWMDQAIGDKGWWKLRRQDLINDPKGYVEYISTLPVAVKSNTSEDFMPVTITPVTQEHNGSDTSPSEANSTISITTREEVSRDQETTVSNEDNHPKSSETLEDGNQMLWRYAPIIIGTILLLTVLSAFACVMYRKRNSSRFRILTKEEIDEFRHGVSENDYKETGDENLVNVSALKMPYDTLLEIPKKNLELLPNQFLGGGEFGCVFKALLTNQSDNQTEVALKSTKPNAGATAVKGLLSEIKILSYLGRHPNIVPIIGAYTAEMCNGTVYIATELCSRGSLKNYLKVFQDDTKLSDMSSVPLGDMIRWSCEIASGMEYLDQKGVIHADLAARNVLLSSERIAKITDFGLSRRLYEYTNYTKTSQEPLPWRWMAFESLKRMEFSSKSDVWSYGVTLWEIFSLGAQPYPGLTWTIDFVETLEEGLMLKKPRHAPSEIFELMKRCWILDKDMRPSFTELKTCMQQIHNQATDSVYTKLAEGTDEHNLVKEQPVLHEYV